MLFYFEKSFWLSFFLKHIGIVNLLWQHYTKVGKPEGMLVIPAT